MKRQSIILFCSLLCLLLSSCQLSPPLPNTLQGIPVDNVSQLDEIATTEYALQDLNDYFAAATKYDLGISAANDDPNMQPDRVSEVFPITALRLVPHHNPKASAEFCYAVFKVKEGGYYYLFWMWCKSDNTLYFERPLYVNGWSQVEDFSALKVGESTYADVVCVNPTTELYISNDYILSYSPLKDGTMMEIEYYTQTYCADKQGDLVIKQMQCIKDEPYRGYFCYILPEDLPNNDNKTVNSTTIGMVACIVTVVFCCGVVFIVRQRKRKHKKGVPY